MNSSTALSLSSLEYKLTSKPLWLGSNFRQHPPVFTYRLTETTAPTS